MKRTARKSSLKKTTRKLAPKKVPLKAKATKSAKPKVIKLKSKAQKTVVGKAVAKAVVRTLKAELGNVGKAHVAPTHTLPPAQEMVVCAISGHEVPLANTRPLSHLRPRLVEAIKRDYPDLAEDARISHAALARYRMREVESMLLEEHGEVSELDREVAESIAEHGTIAEDVETDLEEHRTFGERAADTIADFGGSWTFILCFFTFLVGWMLLNVLALSDRGFDPYPFILLNLILSCLAAIQAPIIMMSQNRQEAKDRARNQNDYQINLKAELEIRQLHEKLDHLLTRQWERMTEIQRIQTELLHDLSRRK